MLADLIVVDADPLTSVENLLRISHVIVRGRLFDPSELLPIASPTEARQ
jgi:imidazolonepropionase-like amidohydrolase